MIKLIASDLDGTIVAKDGTISERTKRAFIEARESGIQIVFVTGRPFRWLTPIIEAFGGMGKVICSNGAVLYDLEQDEVIWSRTLSAATARKASEIILELEPKAAFAAETTKGLHLGDGFADRHHNFGVQAVLDLTSDSIDSEGIVKFLARSPHLPIDKFYASAGPQLAQLVSVTHSAFDVSLLEMAHVDIHKATTLHEYCQRLGIAADEVMAFGDMPNDIEMLEYAGHGYAMSSGHPTTLASARFRAPSLAEDGVAQVIEDLLK
ncbi:MULTISPECIES: HAD family hydrolase [Glutamicibacter]|uniref:HAD family hydrolase n=1 Tax=Glutamicibacter TaxID=1742989 RepID=UPI000EF86283|nr:MULTISPECIES: HAD family hydrolase [Glutamicibacter]MDV2978283.1 HAD family hydrolase [Actinomycetes bacterium ARC8]QEP05801.1 HAD family hydrolase [Glutamicibacter sp. ZJUTW]WIV44083.1 HAD family hydrolase [Glutamicibacter nicotianae]